MARCLNSSCGRKFRHNWTREPYCKPCRAFVYAQGRLPSPEEVNLSPGEVKRMSPRAARALHFSQGRVASADMEVSEMEEGKRFIGMINVAPDPHVIVALVQNLHHNGNHVRAFSILSAGWPQMKIGKAERLLRGEIGIEEALAE